MDNEYDQQAQEFLDKTGTTMFSNFIKFDFHFEDDKHKRNIFEIILRNGRHSYSFNFGSSLQDSLSNCKDLIYEDHLDFYYGLKYENMPKQCYMSYSEKIPIKEIQRRHESNTPLESFISKAKAEKIYKDFKAANTSKHVTVNIISLGDWIDKLKGAVVRRCHEEVVDKNFGIGVQAEEIKHPRPYDVLTCLTKNDPGTFENFCGDFGYDTDSRKAEKTYHAVVDEWKNVAMLFNEEELQLLQEIQ